MLNFTIAGLGYVGTSMASILCMKYRVCVFDIDLERINNIRRGELPIHDPQASDTINQNLHRLTATSDAGEAFAGANIVILCTPTNFYGETGTFDTGSLEDCIKKAIQFGDSPHIVIKSTIPVGFTDSMRSKFNYDQIYFSPEFLREGRAFQDNLTPSRIIVGDTGDFGNKFAKILAYIAHNNPPRLLMSSREAEMVKLAANSYLAMRVAYFNEIDSYALEHNLSAEKIIEGVCTDPRIGAGYNNPSFGYGGYCLPKDTKQLRAEFEGIPQNLVGAVVKANDTRLEFLSQKIIERALGEPIGVYRLQMKAGSDNIRESAPSRLIEKLKDRGAEVLIYEPMLTGDCHHECAVIEDFSEFIDAAGVIVANRNDTQLDPYAGKLFTRDVFGEN